MNMACNTDKLLTSREAALFQQLISFGKLHGEVNDIYRTLVSSTINIPDESIPLRRPSMFADGTKIGFSFKTQVSPIVHNKQPLPVLRTLVEPGGIGLDLAGQINFTLSTLNRLLTLLNWSSCAPDINSLVKIAFPPDATSLDVWWGGIWLGSESSSSIQADLRIYLNLRSGSLAERWQRVADMLAPYAPQSMAPGFYQLMEQTISCNATPVGLAIVFKEGELTALRLYLGIENPTPATVCMALPKNIDHADYLNARMQSLVNTFGPFAHNAVTVAYDFAIKDRLVQPEIVRFKADVGCTDYHNRIFSWLENDLDPVVFGQFSTYTEHLKSHFGSAAVDYLSFGFRKDGRNERTAYYLPGGLDAGLP